MNFNKTILLPIITVASFSSVVSAGPSIGYDGLKRIESNNVTSIIRSICMVEVNTKDSHLVWDQDSSVELEFNIQNNISAETTITLKGYTEVKKIRGDNAAEYIDVELDGAVSKNFTLKAFNQGKTFKIKNNDGLKNSILAILTTNKSYDKVIAGHGLKTAMIASISCK